MRWHIAAIFVAVFLALITACETLGPDSNSSKDFERSGAKVVELNRTVIDDVSCIDGDKTDWKQFTVVRPGRVAVTFAFDEPAAGGKVGIHFGSGELITSANAIPGSRTTMEVDVVKGFYYLEITCQAYKSEYTLEVTVVR